MAALKLVGLTSLVTGAAQGIGFGCATQLSIAGAAVVLADIDIAQAEASAAALRAQGHKATAVQCDVRDKSQVDAGGGRSCSFCSSACLLALKPCSLYREALFALAFPLKTTCANPSHARSCRRSHSLWWRLPRHLSSKRRCVRDSVLHHPCGDGVHGGPTTRCPGRPRALLLRTCSPLSG